MESITDWAFSWPISGVGGDGLVNKMHSDHGWQRLEHTLIVIDNIAQMVTSTVMSFAHTHRVMSEVDIAVITFEDVLASSSRNWR